VRLALLALAIPVTLAAQQVPPRDTVRHDTGLVRVDSVSARPPVGVPLTDTTAPRPQHGDSIRPRPPISPGTAFLRSFVLPGWGQASLNRNVTGGVFVAFEGIAIAMVWKSGWQTDFARVRNKNVQPHIQERQDWTVLLVFNHLMAATEAFVSANLYDFPAALDMRELPDGSTGYGVRVRF
jgi:hypothetical protein